MLSCILKMKRRSEASFKADEENGSPAQKAKMEKAEVSPARKGIWTETTELLLFRSEGATLTPKLAAFDMDGTLINTKSGKRFPTGPDDWVLWSQTIPPKLKSLIKETPPFCIVLITNQAAIERAPGGGKPAFKRKIEAVVAALGVPCTVLIAIDPDGCCLYRKPCTGGLNYLADLAKKEAGIIDSEDSFWDFKHSFYCGDAAGRIDGWKPGAKKDFACSDRLFALNAGLAFYTPEEFFLGHKPAPFKMPEFSPMKVETTGRPTSSILASDQKELVIYVGPPACGKSSFSKKHFLSTGRYDILSRDDLGTWQKVAAAARKSLTEGRSVVIDNTNPDAESRSRYLDIAKELKIPARCFIFATPLEQAKHNEKFRRLAQRLKPPPKGVKPHTHVPELAYNMYKNKYQEPTVAEGFSEIVHVKFIAEFNDNELEKLYRSYLIDK